MDNLAENELIELADVCSIEQFAKQYPNLGFSRARFDYLICNKKINGILESDVLVKDGKGYKLKATKFARWYYKHINIYGRNL